MRINPKSVAQGSGWLQPMEAKGEGAVDVGLATAWLRQTVPPAVTLATAWLR
ncbi:MAG: hypothetical protein ACE5GE_16215 [Phycisphaerae bacterium]